MNTAQNYSLLACVILSELYDRIEIGRIPFFHQKSMSDREVAHDETGNHNFLTTTGGTN